MARTRGGRQRTRQSARLAAGNAFAGRNDPEPSTVQILEIVESSPSTTNSMEITEERVKIPEIVEEPPSENVERPLTATDAVERPPVIADATEPIKKRAYKKRKGRASEDMEE